MWQDGYIQVRSSWGHHHCQCPTICIWLGSSSIELLLAISLGRLTFSSPHPDTSGPVIKEWLQSTFGASLSTIKMATVPDEVVQV